MKVMEILFNNGGRVKLVVEMPDPARYMTIHAPHIPKLLFKLFPRLAKHRCENDNGFTFRQECRSTEIPHLFEHLIIELQDQACAATRLKGETQWNWHVDPRGRFHVYVDYENELLALGAIHAAERIINALDAKCLDDLDVEQEIEALKRLAAVGHRVRNGTELAPEEAQTAA